MTIWPQNCLKNPALGGADVRVCSVGRLIATTPTPPALPFRALYSFQPPSDGIRLTKFLLYKFVHNMNIKPATENYRRHSERLETASNQPPKVIRIDPLIRRQKDDSEAIMLLPESTLDIRSLR